MLEAAPLLSAQCERCESVFEYEDRGKLRTVCSACRRKAKNFAVHRLRQKLKLDEGGDIFNSSAMLPLALRTEASAAALLDLHTSEVSRAVRQAIVKLRKLLRSPVHVCREAVDPVEYSYHEMETSLARWRVVLTMMDAEIADDVDSDLGTEADELRRQISEFDTALRAAVNQARQVKGDENL